jgi:hypothetical protein
MIFDRLQLNKGRFTNLYSNLIIYFYAMSFNDDIK